MPARPIVSIVVTVLDDGDGEAALRTCTAQQVSALEIVCVVGSPGAGDAVERAAQGDRRVRVLRLPGVPTVAEARREGARAAAAPFVMFVERGDELTEGAVTAIAHEARETGPDLMLLGVAGPPPLPHDAGQPMSRERLHDEEILRALFPEDAAVDRRSWRFLFRTGLVCDIHDAVSGTPAQDDGLCVLFLACAAARTLTSMPAPVYRRTLARDGAPDLARALDAIDSFTAIAPIVRERARHAANPEPLVEGYEHTRLSLIGDVLGSLEHAPDDVRDAGIAALLGRVSALDAVIAASAFAPALLQALAQRGGRIELGQRRVRSVLLTTNVLRTGGVSGVLLAQARVLLGAGYRVAIATHRSGSDTSAVPDGATLVPITATTQRERLAQWAQACDRHEVDVVIDHRVLYSRDWPGFALAARARGAATIGWIHNFAGRPTYNGNELHSLIRDHAGALAHLVVLSPLDVAFWKLRGIPHVSYLPNPPSPLLLEAATTTASKHAPTNRALELVWWGRLEEHTKKVTELIEVAAALRALEVGFRLRIVGPDWADMTAPRLSALAAEKGVAELVEVTGPLRGQELLDAIDSADVFVNTSIIEGYPLTIPEAQSRGLPVVMYDLPWLSLIEDNRGVLTVPQGDAGALASAVAALAADPERYTAMSQASLSAARRATAHDFARLYEQLVVGGLPDELSPTPTVEDGGRLLELLAFFAERSVPSAPPPRRPGGSTASAPRRRSRPRTVGARIERWLTPVGHRALALAPWLRPAARQVKLALLRR
ncbi:MAG: glycosyltransferase [Microbacterium sp.]